MVEQLGWVSTHTSNQIADNAPKVGGPEVNAKVVAEHVWKFWASR